MRPFFAVSAAFPVLVAALDKRSVTIHGPGVTTTSTAAAADATYTGAAAYDTTNLNPPAPPTDLNKDIPVQLYTGGMDNLSIKQKGSFLGFSIELSVADQIRTCKVTCLQFSLIYSYYSWEKFEPPTSAISEPHVQPQGARRQSLHSSWREHPRDICPHSRWLQLGLCY